jgi:hypothetical protein
MIINIYIDRNGIIPMDMPEEHSREMAKKHQYICTEKL